MPVEFRQVDRENLRQHILEVLYAGENYCCQHRETVMGALDELAVKYTVDEYDRAIRYLLLLKLITVQGVAEPLYCLTAEAVNICERNIPPPTGISPLD